MFVGKLDSVRFFVEACPGIVASTFDLHVQWSRRATDILIASDAFGIEVVGSIEVVVLASDRGIVLGSDIHHWQCARRVNCVCYAHEAKQEGCGKDTLHVVGAAGPRFWRRRRSYKKVLKVLRVNRAH